MFDLILDEFKGMTPEQVMAEREAYDPGTPEYETMLAILKKNDTPEYQDRVRRLFQAILWKIKTLPEAKPIKGNKDGRTTEGRGPMTSELIAVAEQNFYYLAALSDWSVSEEDIRRAQPRYGPWNLCNSEDAPWPTGRAIRFAQTQWMGSRWLMVPNFPSELLAMMGYKLHTPTRYLDHLTDEEISELAWLHWRGEVSGTLTNQKIKGFKARYLPSLTDEEVGRISELLGDTDFGGELPVFDVDSSGPKNPETLTAEQLLEENTKLARRGAGIAKTTDALWRSTTGAAVQWTVTNDRGGLHGRHMAAPMSLRHPYLCLAIEAEIRRLAGENLPILDKDGKENQVKVRDVRVSLDLTSYHKKPDARGGVWRAPGCKKAKVGSLPQTPVERYVKKLPWLDQLTPEALGSGPTRLRRDAVKKILAICDEYQRKVEADEIASGAAKRNPHTGKLERRAAKRVLKPDLDLGVTEFTETAKAIRAAMPERGSGVSRHGIRLALAGWLIGQRVPTEAVRSTLAASAGNAEDAIDAVNSTVAALRAGKHVTGAKALSDYLGKDKFGEIHEAFDVDLQIRRYEEEQEPAESPETMEIGLDPNDGDPGAFSGDLPEPEPPKQEPPKQEPPKQEPPKPTDGAPVVVTPAPTPIQKALQPSDDSAYWATTSTHMAIMSFQSALKAGKTWEAPSESSLETPAEREERVASGVPERPEHKLERFAATAKPILKKVPPEKRFFAEKALAGVFALSAIGKETTKRTLHAAGVGSVSSEVSSVAFAAKRWKPGQGKPPKEVVTWSFFKMAEVKYKDIVRMQEALSEDLEALHAPLHVQRNCMIEQPWRSHQRKFLSDVCEGFRGFDQASPDARRAQIQKVERVVNGSAVLEVDHKGERTKVTVELTSLLLSCEPPYLTFEEPDVGCDGEEHVHERPVWFRTAAEAADAERAAVEAGSPPDPTDPKPFVVEQADTLVGRSFGLLRDVKALKAVRESCMCMTVGHEKHCRTHGEVGLVFTRCKRETACPSCRSMFWDFINRWINDMKRWPEKVLVAKIMPTPGAVPVDDRQDFEVDDEDGGSTSDGKKDGKAADTSEKPPEKKPELSMMSWLETTNLTETLPDGRRRYRVPTREEQRRQEAEEQKHRLTVARQRMAEKKAKKKETEPEKKPTRSRKVGEHMSNAVRDRIRHAIENDPGMQMLLGNPEINRVLGIRVWAGMKHGLVFLPEKFVRLREDGTPFTNEIGQKVETDTLEHLRTVGALQAPENELRLVTRAEACSLLIQLRDQITESYDHMVLGFTQRAHEELRENGEEAYRLKVRELGARLLAHEYLQPGAMKPLKHNRMSEESLPWFTKEDQEAFLKAKAEEEGRDRDRCPVLVKKHATDLGCPCGLILETVTIDIRSGGVLLKNRNGYTPSREEAWDAYQKAGLKVGEFHPRSHWIGEPPNEARAAG